MTDKQAHTLLVLAAEVQRRNQPLASFLTSAALGERWTLDHVEDGVRFDKLRFAIDELRSQVSGDPSRRDALDALLATYSANGVPLGRRREAGLRRTRISDRAAGHPPLPGPCVTNADFMFARPDEQLGTELTRLPWLLGTRSEPIRSVITKTRGVMALHDAVAARGAPINGVQFVRPSASYVYDALRQMLDRSCRELATVLPNLADALKSVEVVNQHGELVYTGTATFDTTVPAGSFLTQRSAHVPTGQRRTTSWVGAYGFDRQGLGVPGRITPAAAITGGALGLDDPDDHLPALRDDES